MMDADGRPHTNMGFSVLSNSPPAPNEEWEIDRLLRYTKRVIVNLGDSINKCYLPEVKIIIIKALYYLVM